MFAAGDAAKTQARPDRHGPSGPREIDAGWMGAHAPITNLERKNWRANPLMRRQLMSNWRLGVDDFCVHDPGRLQWPYLSWSRPVPGRFKAGRQSCGIVQKNLK